MKKLAFFRILVLTLVISVIGCNKKDDKDKDKNGIKAKIPVETAISELGNIEALYSGSAVIEAEKEAIIVSKTSGYIKKMYTEEGKYVRKGRLVVKLESEKEELELKRQELTLKKSEADLKRNEELFSGKIISKEEFENHTFRFHSEKNIYNIAKLNLDYTKVKAPISGIITKRFIKEGNLVSFNEPLFKVVNFNSLVIKLHIPETEMNKIKLKQIAEIAVDAIPGKYFSGIIKRISPVIDAGSGTFALTISVDNSSKSLKPGMFSRVKIVYDTHRDTILIPKDAVLSEDGELSVFVVKNGKAFKTPVKIGYSKNDIVEILSGVKTGTEVVTLGASSLKDKALIKIAGAEEASEVSDADTLLKQK